MFVNMPRTFQFVMNYLEVKDLLPYFHNWRSNICMLQYKFNSYKIFNNMENIRKEEAVARAHEHENHS